MLYLARDLSGVLYVYDSPKAPRWNASSGVYEINPLDQESFHRVDRNTYPVVQPGDCYRLVIGSRTHSEHRGSRA